MILDPRTMDGIGPPPINRSHAKGLAKYKAAMPYAYAFLDKPVEKQGRRSPQETARQPRDEGLLPEVPRGIEWVKIWERSAPPPAQSGENI